MRKNFYGYRSAFSAYTVTFAALSLFSIYNCIMPQIMERLNITAAQLGFASTIQTIVGFVLSFFAGPIYKRVRADIWLKMTPFAMILFVLICLYAPSVYFIYIAMVIWGVFYTFSCVTGTNVIISEWFLDKREEMMSYTQACASVGMTSASFIFSILGQFLSVDTTIYILLVVYSILGILFIFGIKPLEKTGQKPLGADNAHTEEESPAAEQEGMEFKDAVKTPTMILLCISLFIGGLALIIGSYATIILTAYGFSAANAALALTFFSLVTALGSILMGKIAAKTTTKIYVILIHALLILSIFLLYIWTGMANPAFLPAILIFGILGLAQSGINIFTPLMLPRLFGIKSFSAIMPIVMGFFTIGLGISGSVIPAIAGAGGWDTACLAAIAMVAVCFAGTFLGVCLAPAKEGK